MGHTKLVEGVAVRQMNPPCSLTASALRVLSYKFNQFYFFLSYEGFVR